MDTLQQMMENSFKNFHAKGLDYICLKRTPEYTEKVYFFEGNVTTLPQVINPHDHRYNFETRVLTGVMSDSLYEITTDRDVTAKPYNYLKWRTPLNGGDGSEYVGRVHLKETTRAIVQRGETLKRTAEQIHTIRMHTDTCVLHLKQYADKVPLNQPTRLFMEGEKRVAALRGLYEKFTEDQLLKRLDQFAELMGYIKSE